MELSFPSKMNRIGNVQLWVLSSKLMFILLRIRIIVSLPFADM